MKVYSEVHYPVFSFHSNLEVENKFIIKNTNKTKKFAWLWVTQIPVAHIWHNSRTDHLILTINFKV